MTGGRTIAGQYGRSPRQQPQQQKQFGRIDPFCLFAVLPILIIAGLFIWGGIAVLGVVLILIALLVVAADSWANRPVRRTAPRNRQDY